MKSADIRTVFLDFFHGKGHEVVTSSSLVPADDPSLLFTNSGMVQFKDVFLGSDTRPYSRAASSQRCVRAGGKHNDLENVGYTGRHHTFFEMLGNFSFGDYFKREAILYAWEFLTTSEWMDIPADRLLVTVYSDDDESYDIWAREVGVPEERIISIGDTGEKYSSDNFWAMGDAGPCGPCTEIFYDHGEDVPGGPPGSPDADGDRFVEVWNLVFMQFNRSLNGSMQPLPKPSVDTGMGLERMAAVKQGVHSNYEIDLFQNLLRGAAEATGMSGERTFLDNTSLRVIADHIRSCAFLIADGVVPSNEGRGYVLRRIIRRALRHGKKLGCQTPFFARMAPVLATEMGDAYPELRKKSDQLERTLLAEEEQFAKTLDLGMAALESAIAGLGEGTSLPGELVFKLHDTYGFPTDLTNDIVRERGLSLDMEGFEHCMEEQRLKSQEASTFGLDYDARFEQDGDTEFSGYAGLESRGTVLAILVAGERVDSLDAGQEGILVLDRTTFYAESGGQVGDTGKLVSESVRFDVSDCQKQSDHHLHLGRLVQGTVQLGDELVARVDGSQRQATALNHSATHLLHAALREVLGDQVSQQGSLVNAQRLRFDFSHFQALTLSELNQIERLVNDQIRRNTDVQTELLSMDVARERGALALFSEKYGDEVRVLTMGEGFSVELCGGTHVARTGDIGLFKIVSESGVASGVRRIEAVTGEAAEAYLKHLESRLEEISGVLKANPHNLIAKAQQLVRQNRDQQQEIKELKIKLAGSSGSDLSAQAVDVGGIKLLAERVEGIDAKGLRGLVDQMKAKLGSAVVVLGTASEGKVALVCGVTQDLTDRVQAGPLLGHVAEQVGGKGGGRPEMAQGGGSQPEKLDEALASVAERLGSTLS